MTDGRPPDLCRGPIDPVTFRCAWCKADYPDGCGGRCVAERTDRPRKEVAPLFAPIHGVAIRINCWNCKAYATLNSLQHPKVYDDLMSGMVLISVCEQCGVGIDVRKATIIPASGATSLGNGRMDPRQRNILEQVERKSRK